MRKKRKVFFSSFERKWGSKLTQAGVHPAVNVARRGTFI